MKQREIQKGWGENSKRKIKEGMTERETVVERKRDSNHREVGSKKVKYRQKCAFSRPK